VTAKTKRTLSLVGGLVSLLLAIQTAAGLSGRVRNVDILLLFATGMGAGVSLVGLFRDLRAPRGD
jgi:hypothetical protein